MIGTNDGTNCDSCKGKASNSNQQAFSKLCTSCYITLIQLRVRMFPLLYLKASRSSTSCSKILAEISWKLKIIQNITIVFNGKEIMSCLLRSGCSHSANILLGRYLRRGFFCSNGFNFNSDPAHRNRYKIPAMAWSRLLECLVRDRLHAQAHASLWF